MKKTKNPGCYSEFPITEIGSGERIRTADLCVMSDVKHFFLFLPVLTKNIKINNITVIYYPLTFHKIWLFLVDIWGRAWGKVHYSFEVGHAKVKAGKNRI